MSSHADNFKACRERVTETLDAVAKADEEFREADGAYDRARSARTDRQNKLNNAQAAHDKAVAAFKALSPYDSDWKRSAGIPVKQFEVAA